MRVARPSPPRKQNPMKASSPPSSCRLVASASGKKLQPGRYYANEAAYNITMMSTRVQTWEFKGGYKRRYIDLSLDQAGNLTQAQRSQDVPVPQGSADPAIPPFVQG